MQFIAKNEGTLRHAIQDYRERVTVAAVGGDRSAWRAHSVCGRVIVGSSSGETIPSGIDCATCRRILRGIGWVF